MDQLGWRVGAGGGEGKQRVESSMTPRFLYRMKKEGNAIMKIQKIGA